MRFYFLALVFLAFIAPNSIAKKNIVILAGPPSHGWNEHEFPAGAQTIADALNASQLEIEAKAITDWPENEAILSGIDAVVLYSDGIDDHIAKGKAAYLHHLYEQGTGIAVLHFALEPNDPELAAFFDKTIGGRFQVDWSVNPVWTLRESILANHAIANGVHSFEITDEWYYHIRFADTDAINPILTAHPPADSLGQDGPRSGNPNVRKALAERIPQTLAWTKISPENQRGFGFTGGHYLHNWNNDAFRRLVVNGIAWTAGVEIPPNGIASKRTTFVRHPDLSRAIAYNDLEDIELHLQHDPEALNRIGKSKLAPLHEAILRKKTEAARMLVEKGANINQPDRSGTPPLHIAINRKLPKVAETLIQSGADLTAKDKNGWTALHLAAAKNTVEIAKLIIEFGADIHILSTAGGTPLHEAAASGGADMVQLLLDAGIDSNVISNHNVTALDIAKEYKNEAASELLSIKKTVQ